MTDTERLDFIEKHKLETFWTDGLDEWSIATYSCNGYFYLSANSDLRTAIDEAMKEMRGLSNERN